jgi:hypothetical protein
MHVGIISSGNMDQRILYRDYTMTRVYTGPGMGYCWHFLMQLPSMEVESILGNGARNAYCYFLAPSLKLSKP